MALKLTLREKATVPIEVEGILPETTRNISLGQIEKLEVFLGNRKQPLAELFQVSGDPADETIEWEGDLSGVHWVGAKMACGTIRVSGHAGRHVGSEMTGGEIHVAGDAGDWVGGEMHGGLIHVHGRAGHLIGAAYRGSRRGMTGGTILIGGDVGNEIGHTMRRGLLAIGGSAGDLIGFNMIAGTILVFGQCGIRHGAGMRRGTIGLLGPEPTRMLPSFVRACRFRPTAISMVFRHLSRQGLAVPDQIADSQFELYHGDLITGGRGEILQRASELSQ